MDRARGCPCVRLLLCLSFAALALSGCSTALGKPPYCPAKPAAVRPPAAGGPGGALHRRALAYDRLFQERLQPRPYGGAVNVVFEKGSEGSLGSLVGYDDQQDSAIWTGIYLAAQAFRYAASTDPAEKQEALQNARSAARTLHLFLEVTNQPGLLARFAGPFAETAIYLRGQSPCSGVGSGNQASDSANLCCLNNLGCAQSSWDSSLFWLGGTTRDQYTGWFFGMGIAYRLINDPELRQLIRQDIAEVVTALQDQKWIILGPEPDRKPTHGTASVIEPMMQAAWLLLAAEASDDPAYCRAYEKLVRDPLQMDLLLAENDFDWTNRYMQYYGFNLTFLTFYNLIQLEPQEARRHAYLIALQDHAYSQVKGTGNSFFDYIALASGVAATGGILDSARGSLRDFPESSFTCVVPPESTLSQASVDLYEANELLDPNDPKKLLFHPQAERPYPITEWCSQDFLWQQTPYAICCCPVPESQQWSLYQSVCGCTSPPVQTETQTLVYPGVDYLIAYWMGRYYNFLDPKS